MTEGNARVRQGLIAGRYRLLDLVGTGGMGRVWLARDEMLHRDVAVKEVVPPNWLAEAERYEVRLRSLREARTAARLAHPNVVRVYDVVHDGDSPWIVMEYVPSRSLQQIITTDGPLSPRRTARIGLAVLAALRAAHTAGVLHRDVKPHNVLVADDGRVVLTDFGLATFDGGDGAMTGPGMVFGSPQFVAPERARAGISDPRTDLWSLGATLYAAVEGQSPYARATAMATLSALATEPPDPMRRAGPLRPLLTGLLRRDPWRRLTAAEAEPLLHAAAADHDRPAGPTPPPGAGRPGRAAAGPTSTPDRPVGAGQGATPTDRPARAVAGRGATPADGPAVGQGAAPADGPAGAAVGRTAEPTAGPAGPAASTHARTGRTPIRVDGAPARSPGRLTRVARRRRSWIVVGAVFLMLATLGIGPALVTGDGGRPDPGAGSGGGVAPERPAAFACATPPPGAAPVPSMPPPTGALRLVRGWTWHVDPEGWRIAAPVAWLRWTEGTVTCFREPGGVRMLSVEAGPRRPDPVGWWRAEEQRLTGDGLLTDYRRFQIAPLDMFDGAAVWECAWANAAGVRVHTARLLLNVPTGRAYTVSWLTTEFDWAVNNAYLLMIRQSFTPLP
ncbi:serine/threonine-protein kinase [Micromonospora thermarum]|uniref:serine/threonine-protein kinase n=1 Tax=Micromonospora thermarum TaxID=2720024 RepID=UPI002815BC57|nr:protein kinase [Micromonospora thermarum]